LPSGLPQPKAFQWMESGTQNIEGGRVIVDVWRCDYSRHRRYAMNQPAAERCRAEFEE